MEIIEISDEGIVEQQCVTSTYEGSPVFPSSQDISSEFNLPSPSSTPVPVLKGNPRHVPVMTTIKPVFLVTKIQQDFV